MAEAKLGRPCLPPERRHDVRRSVYVTEATHERYLRLFLRSGHRSESAFLAELLALGAQVKEAQITAGDHILDVATHP